MRWHDGRRRQSLEDFGDQAGDRLQPFQAIFDAPTPGFDFHLPFQDRGHPHIILVPFGKRCFRSRSGWLDDGFGWHQLFRRSLSRQRRCSPCVERIYGFPLVLDDGQAAWIVFFHSPGIDGGKPVGDGAQDQRGHTLRSARGFHPCEDQVFRHSLAALDALHLGIGVDLQIFAEEPQDDSWPTIGQTDDDDGLAVEGQGMLLNRDEFLLVVHLSPLSRGVYSTRPFSLHRLARSGLLLEAEGPLQEVLSLSYDTG